MIFEDYKLYTIVYNLTYLNIISGLYTNCIQFVYDQFCIQIVYSDCIQFEYNPENFFHVGVRQIPMIFVFLLLL